MKSVNEQQNVVGGEQPQPSKQKYVAPAIEVMQVQTEKGYAGSIAPIGNRPWEY